MTFWSSPLLVAPALLLALAPACAPVPAGPDNPFRLKPGAAGKLCLDCHTDFQQTMARRFVHTPARAGDCASCHDAHASDHGKLLAADPDAICATCHAGLVPQDAISSHDDAARGRCVQCHDPHASDHEKLLRDEGNRQCLSCHTEIGAALAGATSPHPPVGRDCLGCHTPHASTVAPALLSRAVPALCVGCHDPKQAGFAGAHMGYDVADADCGSCHDPHGSKNEGILWASVHTPVARKLCSQCHAAPQETAPLATKYAGADLCRGCHNDLFNSIAARRTVHGPLLDATGCGHCHTPHAGPVDKLLAAPQQQLCGDCHQDLLRRHEQSRVKHPPVADGDCSSCHDPHAADAAPLLLSDNVCGTCHDWKTHSAHPMGPEVIDPRNRNLRLDCLSCHRNHGTAEDNLAYFDPKQALCVNCHSQLSR